MTIELPWVQQHPFDPGRTYVAMASQLPLRRHAAIPGFLADTLRIRRQLAGTSGLVAYGLRAHLAGKTFWTFSIWDDQASLDAFAGSDPHRRITQRLKPRMVESHVELFPITGSELPWSWERITTALGVG